MSPNSPEKNKIFAGKRIGIVGKGGAGKSTITVLSAKAFRKQGYNVCILDADSTNIGLHQALGLAKPSAPLMDYFGGSVFSGGLVTCPVDDPTLLSKGEISLDKLPNEYYAQSPDGIFLLVAGKIGGKGPGAGCDGPISKITRDLKISGIGNNPVTLIDLKAGLEDPSRGVITSLDWVITVVDPTSAAIQVAVDIKNMVEQIKKGKLPATEHLETPELVEAANKIFREAKIKDSFVILNKIKDKKIENYMNEKLKEKGIVPVGVVHEDSVISFSWMKETPLEGVNIEDDVGKFVKRLEKRIVISYSYQEIKKRQKNQPF